MVVEVVVVVVGVEVGEVEVEMVDSGGGNICCYNWGKSVGRNCDPGAVIVLLAL